MNRPQMPTPGLSLRNLCSRAITGGSIALIALLAVPAALLLVAELLLLVAALLLFVRLQVPVPLVPVLLLALLFVAALLLFVAALLLFVAAFLLFVRLQVPVLLFVAVLRQVPVVPVPAVLSVRLRLVVLPAPL